MGSLFIRLQPKWAAFSHTVSFHCSSGRRSSDLQRGGKMKTRTVQVRLIVLRLPHKVNVTIGHQLHPWCHLFFCVSSSSTFHLLTAAVRPFNTQHNSYFCCLLCSADCARGEWSASHCNCLRFTVNGVSLSLQCQEDRRDICGLQCDSYLPSSLFTTTSPPRDSWHMVLWWLCNYKFNCRQLFNCVRISYNGRFVSVKKSLA